MNVVGKRGSFRMETFTVALNKNAVPLYLFSLLSYNLAEIAFKYRGQYIKF